MVAPVIKMNYTYKHPMNTMVMAYMRKYIWEDRFHATSIAHVEQPDENTVVYYRRQESMLHPGYAWERVTIDRSTQKMTAEIIGQNTDGTEQLIDRHTFVAKNDNVENTFETFSGRGNSFKVEQYKGGIMKTLQAIKFHQMDKAE